jgi:hypothetical protein
MYCGKCENEFESCTCPDLPERLRKLSGPGGPTVARWCERCDSHWILCQCGEDARWMARWEGKLIPLEELVAVDGTRPFPS